MSSPGWKSWVFFMSDTSLSNPVNHPPHYGGDSVYEAIKVIEAWNLGFNLGNTVKYISRAGKKVVHSRRKSLIQETKSAQLLDLEKARWYLDREIALIKGDSTQQ